MVKRMLIAGLTYELVFFGMVVGLRQRPEAIVMAANVCFLLWLAMEAARVPLGHTSGVARTYGLFSRAFLVVSFVSVGVGFFDVLGGYLTSGHPLPTGFVGVGLVVMAIGVYLRHLSIKTLGRFFVTKVQVAENHQLVKKGIYRTIRHPSYTGLILGFLGMLLMLRSSAGLVVFCAVGIPAYLYRIHVEEAALLAKFGDEYALYQSESCALVPFLY